MDRMAGLTLAGAGLGAAGYGALAVADQLPDSKQQQLRAYEEQGLTPPAELEKEARDEQLGQLGLAALMSGIGAGVGAGGDYAWDLSEHAPAADLVIDTPPAAVVTQPRPRPAAEGLSKADAAILQKLSETSPEVAADAARVLPGILQRKAGEAPALRVAATVLNPPSAEWQAAPAENLAGLLPPATSRMAGDARIRQAAERIGAGQKLRLRDTELMGPLLDVLGRVMKDPSTNVAHASRAYDAGTHINAINDFLAITQDLPAENIQDLYRFTDQWVDEGRALEAAGDFDRAAWGQRGVEKVQSYLDPKEFVDYLYRHTGVYGMPGEHRRLAVEDQFIGALPPNKIRDFALGRAGVSDLTNPNVKELLFVRMVDQYGRLQYPGRDITPFQDPRAIAEYAKGFGLDPARYAYTPETFDDPEFGMSYENFSRIKGDSDATRRLHQRRKESYMRSNPFELREGENLYDYVASWVKDSELGQRFGWSHPELDAYEAERASRPRPGRRN